MGNLKWGALLLSAGLLLSGCSEETEAETNKEAEASAKLLKEQKVEITELQQEKAELQGALEELELNLEAKTSADETEYYLGLAKGLIDQMSKEEKEEFAQDLWEYELAVDGQPVDADGKVETAGGAVEITLAQRQPPYLALPYDQFEAAKISGDYLDHIVSMNPEPSELSGLDGTIVTAGLYIYHDLKSGESISLEITEELKERLGLDTVKIEVTAE